MVVLENKVIVVTGANRGIGFEVSVRVLPARFRAPDIVYESTAEPSMITQFYVCILQLVKQLAERAGNTIIATARDPAKAEDLKAIGSNVDVTQLDTSDETSIDTWADSLKEKYSHVDVRTCHSGPSCFPVVGWLNDSQPIFSSCRFCSTTPVSQWQQSLGR